jgi:hypothetical protein
VALRGRHLVRWQEGRDDRFGGEPVADDGGEFLASDAVVECPSGPRPHEGLRGVDEGAVEVEQDGRLGKAGGAVGMPLRLGRHTVRRHVV